MKAIIEITCSECGIENIVRNGKKAYAHRTTDARPAKNSLSPIMSEPTKVRLPGSMKL